MALGERTTSQVLHDILTSVTRTDQALLTLLENPSIAGLERSWRTLVNPDEARPEDLKQLSDRVFGVEGGFSGFLLDMGLSPTMWFGLPLAKGADRLGFGQGKPTRLLSMWKRDFGDGYVPLAYRNYIGISEDMGQSHWGRMAVVGAQRQSKFAEEGLSRLKKVIDPWIAEHGEEAWERRMADMTEVGFYRDGADAWRDPGVMKMMADIQEAMTNWVWDRVSIIESLEGMTEQDMIGAKRSGHVLDFLRAKLDLDPMGYVGKYLPWMVDPDKGMLDLTLDSLNADKLPNTPLGRLAGHMTDIQSFKNIRGAALGQDTAEVAMAMRQLLSDDDMVRKVTAGYRNPRMRQVLDPALAERIFQMDWMKMMKGYIHKAARSFAMQVPLGADEARWVHRSLEPFVDVERELFGRLNPALRAAMAAGDEGAEAAIRGEIAELWSQMPYQQRSIDLQMTLDAAEHFGADVFKRGDLYGMSVSKTAQARALREMMQLMRGQQDPKEFWVAQGMANLYMWVGRHLTDDRVAALDRASEKMGLKSRLGTMLKDELLNGENAHNMARRERTLTHWAYLAGLGLRPFAALMNLTQIPLTLGPTIGPGNTLRGAYDAGVMVRDSLRAAWTRKQLGDKTGLIQLTKTELLGRMGEMRRYGLVQDIRELEAGLDRQIRTDPDKWAEVMMAPFTWSETFNRLVSFLGAKRMWRNILEENPEAFGFDIRRLAGTDDIASAIGHVDVQDLINREAVKVVGDTQFLPIPGRRTPFQKRWLKGPAMMQFSSYPFGFMNWAVDAGTKAAIDHKAMLVAKSLHEAATRGEKVPAALSAYGRRSYLPYARYLVAMTGLANLGRDVFGFDVAERAAGGMAPLPISDDAPFYPFPVAPIPGAVFGAAKSVLTGDPDDMQPLELPGGKVPVPRMFVPGGVAVSHAARVMNQAYFNGFTGDELASDEDGDGRAYMEFYANLLRAFGAMPEMTRREQQQVRQMFRVRKKMSEYRKRLGTAVLTGDTAGMKRVQQQYAEDTQFVGAPPLQVDTDDLKRIYRSMRTSNFNRQVGALRTAADALGFTREPLGLLTPEEEEALKVFKTGTILLGGQAT